MIKNSCFDKLIVFDIANNHMGDLEFGKSIIKDFDNMLRLNACTKIGFKYAFKLQYRDLDTFIHQDYKNNYDYKFIKRFSETRLSKEQYKQLKDYIKELGYITVCTPFDEKSVDLVVEHDYDIIKIASCSFSDWALLEKASTTNKPLILSVAGATESQIKDVVTFLENRDKQFAIMHCIAEYPTFNHSLSLNQIDYLKNMYPDIAIGYSSHESSGEFQWGGLAYSKGAKILEKHIGKIDSRYGLNDYSCTTDQIEKWIEYIGFISLICGEDDLKYERYAPSTQESDNLKSLTRGCFASTDINPGEDVTLFNTFFAIPTKNNQIMPYHFSKYNDIVAKSFIGKNSSVMCDDVNITNIKEQVFEIISSVKSLLLESNVIIPDKSDVKISHHYGIDKFKDIGCTIFNLINREYCKKIIVLLPGQKNPTHFHKIKEETFLVLYGDLQIDVDGVVSCLGIGSTITVNRLAKHNFGSYNGCIFEEISTTHYGTDSYYDDPNIINNINRKTNLYYFKSLFIK